MYRNPSKSEVIGRCGGDEETNDHAEPTKSNAKKIIISQPFNTNGGAEVVQVKMEKYSNI